MTNIIQQMKTIEAERERMFAIYCADTGAGDLHRPFDNYRAGYQAATSRQEAKIKGLVEALETCKVYVIDEQDDGAMYFDEELVAKALAAAKE